MRSLTESALTFALGALFAILVQSCATWAKPNTALERVCEYTQWEGCRGLAEPTVVITNVLPSLRPTLAGAYYDGEKYIFVSARLTPAQRQETVLHETVHYVSTQLGIRPGRCENEELARTITAAIMRLPYSDAWEKWYRCTK